MPQTTTIYTAVNDGSRFNYLQTQNYLSEYKTDVDKARVRYNLGIPDNYAMTWGNLSGSIANQTDLVSYIRNIKNDILNQYKSSNDAILSLQESISSLNASATTSSTSILNNNQQIALLKTAVDNHESLMLRIQQGLDDLSEMKTDIAQNASQIAQNATKIIELSGGSETSSLIERVRNLELQISTFQTQISTIAGLISQINSNTNDIAIIKTSIATNADQISSISSQLSGYDLSSLNARISALESKIGVVTITDITVNYTSIEDVNIGSEPRRITVTANYSNGSSLDITDQCTLTSNSTMIVTCDNTNKTISFVGEGTTKVAVAYNTFIKYIDITVTGSTTGIQQYIGYADDYTDLFRTGGKPTVAGTWRQDNTPDVHTGQIFGFWIVTTETLASVSELGSYNLNDIFQGTYTYQGNEYKIYMVGPTESTDLTINITK